ncbi:MAG: GGDEF domain-containing protein [Rhizobiaceae bacterium]|nr:GGDEF domain-containing protein [Rhizobiaceae bacterium]
MTGQIFISLLNPGIGLILAAAFLLLWLNLREQAYIAVMAASYAALSAGFLILDIGPALPMELQLVPTNLLFLVAACLLAAAVLGRYRLQVPWFALGAITVAGMGALLWFLLVEPDISYRIYLMSLALAGISFTVLAKLWRVEMRHFIDRLLFWVTLVTCVGSLLRPAAIFLMIGHFDTYDAVQQTLYWSTVQFTQALVSVVVALNLLVAVATDLVAELKQQAQTDKLSGLLNRRGFEEMASKALVDCASRGRPVALLIADLDHFKSINDTYGHTVGDSVIGLFGRMLSTAAAPDMVTGRIGGEEFAILIPGAELIVARLFGERIRAELVVHCAGRLPADLKPTVSVGLHASASRADLYELMSGADFALYEAKHGGRDRVSVFEPRQADAARRLARR